MEKQRKNNNGRTGISITKTTVLRDNLPIYNNRLGIGSLRGRHIADYFNRFLLIIHPAVLLPSKQDISGLRAMDSFLELAVYTEKCCYRFMVEEFIGRKLLNFVPIILGLRQLGVNL